MLITPKVGKKLKAETAKNPDFYLFVEIVSPAKSIFMFVASRAACEVDTEM